MLVQCGGHPINTGLDIDSHLHTALNVAVVAVAVRERIFTFDDKMILMSPR